MNRYCFLERNVFVICLTLLLVKGSSSAIRFVIPDNSPVLQLETEEETPIGTVIATLVATSDRISPVITYSLDSSVTDRLAIGEYSGQLTNKIVLDFEKIRFLNFVAYASTNSGEKATANVILEIININDNIPIFGKQLYTAHISEDASVGSYVTTITAIDADATDQVRYGIVGDEKPPFDITQYNGNVKTTKRLDYESQKEYSLTISATDGKWANLTSLVIQVSDADDQGPAFERTQYNAELLEGEYQQETPLLTVHAYDLDFGLNATVTYIIIQGVFGKVTFSINAFSGEVYVSGDLDRETLQTITIYISAYSTIHQPVQTVLNLKVLDKNDNKPVFTSSSYSAHVNENSIDGTSVLQVKSRDDDEGLNSLLFYRITNTEKVPFTITEDGEIQVKGNLDRETKNIYALVITAQELFTKEKYSAETSVVVSILDVNDNSPVFTTSSMDLNIDENIEAPVFLTQVTATDKDIGTNAELEYFLKSLNGMDHTYFTIDKNTGILLANQKFDRESQDIYTFQIEVSDKANFEARRSSFMWVTVRVDDLNDNIPKFEKFVYESFVVEAVTPSTTIIAVTASDPDKGINGEIKYNLLGEYNVSTFGIDTSSGVITVRKELDRETRPYYEFNVTATDGGGQYSICLLIVTVLDSNDNRPIFEQKNGYVFNITEGDKGMQIGSVKALDSDSGKAGEVWYSIVENKIFSIDHKTGMIYTTEALDREEVETHILTVIATDSVVDYRSSYVQVKVNVYDVNDNPPVFNGNEMIVVVHSASQANTQVYTVHVEDKDVGKNKETIFTSSNLPNYIKLDSTTGVLSLLSNLPENTDSVSLNITAMNTHYPFFNANTVVKLLFTSTTNDAPVFSKQLMYASIKENEPIGSHVIDLQATYQNSVENDQFAYTIKYGGNATFSINQQTGVIETIKVLDREDISKYTLIVSVSIKTKLTSNFATLIVDIDDVNDNWPYFTSQLDTLYIQENIISFYQPLYVNCADDDDGENSKISYSVKENDKIGINEDTGEIFLKEPLDFEIVTEFNMTIICSNIKSSPMFYAEKFLVAKIIDVNDNYPIFNQSGYYVNITENSYPSTDLIHPHAYDTDSELNSRLSYKILSVSPPSECFLIHKTTGKVSTVCEFDREKQESYTLVVKASDSGSPSLSSNVDVYVSIIDINDNIPILRKKEYVFFVKENRKPQVLGQIDIIDNDDEPPCKYCVLSNYNDSFYVTKDGVLGSRHVFDREILNRYEMVLKIYHGDFRDTLKVEESFNNTNITSKQAMNYTTCSINVYVEDENDNPPFFQERNIYTGVKVGSPYGTIVATVQATDYDESPQLLYDINNTVSENEDGTFEIDQRTGEIRTTFSLHHIKKMRRITVKAQDNNGLFPSYSSTNQITVNVLVFDESTMASFTSKVHPSYIKTHQSELESLLSNLTRSHAKVYQILPTTRGGESKVEFYGMKLDEERMLSESELMDSLLEELVSKWNISSIGVEAFIPITQEPDNEREILIGVIIGMSALAVLLMILSVYLWLRGGRRKRARKQPPAAVIANTRLPKPQSTSNIAVIDNRNNSSPNGEHSNRYYVETYESTGAYDTIRYHPQEHPPQSFYGYESHGDANSDMNSGGTTLKHTWAYGENEHENVDTIQKKDERAEDNNQSENLETRDF